MCKYKDIYEMMEHMNMDEIQQHMSHCRQCREQFASQWELFAPELSLTLYKKEQVSKLSRLMKPVFSLLMIAAAAIAVIIMSKTDNGGNEFLYELNATDYMEMTEMLDNDEFIELISQLEEEL